MYILYYEVNSIIGKNTNIRHTDASDEQVLNIIPKSLFSFQKSIKEQTKRRRKGDVECWGKQHELHYKRKRHIHNKEKMLLERELELIQLLLKRSDC